MSKQISAANGATFFIGPASDLPPVDGPTASALTYVQVKKVETIGDYGDTAQGVTFTALDDQRVEKTKGARDAGDLTLTCAFIAGDPGQMAMDAAEATANNFVFKVVLNDEPINGVAPTTTYLFGLVSSNKRQVGAANNVLRIMYSISLNAAPIEIQAH